MNQVDAEGYGLREYQNSLHEDPLRANRKAEKVAFYRGIATNIIQGRLDVERFADEQAERDLGIEALAEHDPLTGLLNRRGFFMMFDGKLAEFRRDLYLSHNQRTTQTLGCLVSIDLDDFGLVNKKYGDPVGDFILTTVAAFVASRVRPGDLAARFGGEEILLYLPGAQLTNGGRAAERARVAMAEHIINEIIKHREKKSELQSIDLDNFNQRASSGIAEFPVGLTEKDLEDPKFRGRLFADAYQGAVRARIFAKQAGKDRTAIKHPDGRLEVITPKLSVPPGTI